MLNPSYELNRRAEMWMKSNDWLKDEAGAAVPDRDSLQAGACARERWLTLRRQFNENVLCL